MAIAELTGQRCSTGTAGATTITLTYPGTPTQGNLLVAAISWRGNTTISAVPSGWTLATTGGNGVGIDSAIYYKLAGASEPTAHQWTLTATNKAAGVGGEWSGIASTSPLDKTASATNSIATVNAGNTGTLTQADELIVCLYSAINIEAWTALSNSQTAIGNVSSTGGGAGSRNTTRMGAKIVSATTAANFTSTLAFSQENSGAVATFKAAAGGTNVSITGQSTTIAQGSLSDGLEKAVTGQSTSTTQGSLSKGLTKEIVGQSTIVLQGNIGDALLIAQVGQSASILQDNISDSIEALLIGVPTALSIDTLTPTITYSAELVGQNTTPILQGSISDTLAAALTGVPVTISTGTVIANADYSAQLIGNNSQVLRGNVLSSTLVNLSGQAITTSKGSISAVVNNLLSSNPLFATSEQISPINLLPTIGQSTSISQQAILLATSRPITGEECISIINSVNSTQDYNVALSGQSTSVSQGSLIAEAVRTLSGQFTSIAQGTLIAEAAGLSGQSTSVSQGTLIAEADTSVVLSGQPTSTSINSLVANTTYPVRYIRDYLNGSSGNAASYWVEIQAFDATGTNIASGKTVTANFTPSEGALTQITNDDTNTSNYVASANAHSRVTVDLGATYNIASVTRFHYNGDNRTFFGTKTETSVDGVTWTVIFSSAISGTYAEQAIGKNDVTLPPPAVNEQQLGTVIPAYTITDSHWVTYTSTAAIPGSYAVINPNSGPGTVVNNDVTGQITRYHAAGGLIIGYISSSYAGSINTARTVAAVKADVDTYLSLYDVDGFFIDEMTTANLGGNVAYYIEVYDYIKAQGDYFIVANPGLAFDEIYASDPVADCFMIFEGSPSTLANFVMPTWTDSYSPTKFCWVVSNATSGEANDAVTRARNENVQYIFATDDIEPNPYDVPPSYWTTFAANLAAGSGYLVGKLNTVNVGALTAAGTSAILSGQSTSVSQGTLITEAVSTLSGQSLITSQANLNSSQFRSLISAPISTSSGLLTSGNTHSLLGVQLNAISNNVSFTSNYILSGVPNSLGIGTVTTLSDANVALLGQATLSNIGSLAVGGRQILIDSLAAIISQSSLSKSLPINISGNSASVTLNSTSNHLYNSIQGNNTNIVLSSISSNSSCSAEGTIVAAEISNLQLQRSTSILSNELLVSSGIITPPDTVNVQLAGISITSAHGLLVSTLAPAITMNSAVAIGAEPVKSSTNPTVSGNSIVASTGSIQLQQLIGIFTNELLISNGIVAPPDTINVQLTGVSTNLAKGVLVSASASTMAITPSSTLTLGVPKAETNRILSSNSTSIGLSGIGSVQVKQLISNALSVSSGNIVIISEDINVQLTGIPISSVQGLMISATTPTIIGSTVVSAAGITKANTSRSLSGSSVSVALSNIGNSKSTTVTGTTASLVQGSLSKLTSKQLNGSPVSTISGTINAFTGFGPILSGVGVSVGTFTLGKSQSRNISGNSTQLIQSYVSIFGATIISGTITATNLEYSMTGTSMEYSINANYNIPSISGTYTVYEVDTSYP